MTRPGGAAVRRMYRGWAVLLAAVVVGGCREGSGAPPPNGGARGEQPTPVEVRPAAYDRATRSMTVSGRVEPIRRVGVNSLLAGSVLEIRAEEGDRVRRGELLARLDDREVAAQLASAEAQLTLARSNFERAEQLWGQRYITRAEYDAAHAEYLAAKAAHEQLQARRSYTVIRSPITGVVTEQRVEAGDVVGNQSRLFTVADMSTLVVQVAVSELEVPRLSAGQRVAVALDAHPGEVLTGRIRRIFPAADSASRLVPVEVALDEAARAKARPGFLARVRFPLEVRDSVLMVPADAVVGSGDAHAVFVVENGHAVRRAVVRGITDSGRVEIRSGLAPGDVVVTAGNATLRDGAPVRIIEAPADRALGGS